MNIGHFYVHEKCALWSEGVIRKKRIREENSSSESPSKPEGPDYRYINVDQAVFNGITQKCVYCKHFGASVKCKASGKYYHWPCATASGSFMYKHKQDKQDIRILVGTDSLEKVSEFCKYSIHIQYFRFSLLVLLYRQLFNELYLFFLQHMMQCTCTTPAWNGSLVK